MAEAEKHDITPGHVFLLFYAVLYGALFTITDKWRPFMGTFGAGEEGCLRFLMSVICYGVLPVAYFVVALLALRTSKKVTPWRVLGAIYAVAPLVFFHFLWVWRVVPNMDYFYSAESRALEDSSVRSSLDWLQGMDFANCCHMVVGVVFLLLGPAAVLFCGWKRGGGTERT